MNAKIEQIQHQMLSPEPKRGPDLDGFEDLQESAEEEDESENEGYQNQYKMIYPSLRNTEF